MDAPLLRLATVADLPALERLIGDSVRGLSRPYYDERQIESGLRYVFGPDTRIIADGSYFVADAGGTIVAAGGWSRRRTLYGGDQMKGAADPPLDPAVDAARIRAFFVHPRHARRGLARALFAACARDAWAAGFRGLELMATAPGEPFYAALGFAVVERVAVPLPGGVVVPFARMTRPLAPGDAGIDSA